MIGLVRLDGQLVWSDAYDKAASGFPAIGDFSGDQQTEAIFIGFDDGIRCYRVATGDLCWTLSLAANHSTDSAVSGDLDGDGRDEAVFATGNIVYCVGTDSTTGEGRIKWQLKMPTIISSPIIADVQSTGSQSGQHLSVLVCGQDGVLYCIDQLEK
jgi:outer membrane protein assembly factor BamB